MKEVKGIIPPIITPMNEDETINEKELAVQVERLIKAGVHGIFAFGTNGEGYILSEEEKERVLFVVIKAAEGRVPIYAGTGCISTVDTIRMSRLAEKMGADILSVITPSFAAASQEELYMHYKKVAEAVNLPVLLYNIPSRTGNSLAPQTVAKLAEIDNIIGVKDSSGNFDNMLQYMELTKNKGFSVLSGNDSLIFWNLLAGGEGGISGCANVFPKNMVAIYENFQKGDMEGARQAQDNIRKFRNTFRYGNPNTIVKAAVELLGYPVGKCRSPFNYISKEGIEEIRRVLNECKADGIE